MRQTDISQRTMERKKNYVGILSSVAFLILADASTPAIAATTPWPLTLRSQIQRLTDVGYRIGLVAAPLCPSTVAGTGISLDYIEAYDTGDRAAVSALLKMTDMPQISAVAPESPADAAGVRPGDELVAIGQMTIAQLRRESTDTSLFADELEQRLAAAPQNLPLRLLILRNGRRLEMEITPQPVCAARYIMKTGAGLTAFSDGKNVAVSNKLIAFTKSNDELALIAAHETGHVINRDGEASGLRERRQMEDRADVMGVRLSYCAGYDPEKAFEFWFRRDAKDWARFLRSPSHRSRKSRVELMRRETQEISCPPSTTYAAKAD